MAKAWRNKAAAKINARKAEGSKEPSARVQMHIRNSMPVKGAGNWLLAGLLIRAGIQSPLPWTLKKHLHEPTIPLTEGFAKKLMRKLVQAKRFFGTRYA